jgi:hypothetical protein
VFPGCKAITKNGSDVTPPTTTTSVPSTFPIQQITCTPEKSESLPGSVAYHSDKNYLSVQLPEGWAASEGPGDLDMFRHEGLISFNSWGQNDFWARAETTKTESGGHTSYNLSIIGSQIPKGGAYIDLVLMIGPPFVPEDYPAQYPCNDVSSLVSPHDWRKDVANGTSFEFFKWGRFFIVHVYCNPEVSDETVNELNQVLLSWTFDENWVGDVEWAATLARTILPAEANPWLFPLPSGQGEDNLGNLHKTESEVSGTTVHFRFTYCPGGISCHWWEIDVPPDGKPVLIGEGGTPLSE